MVARWQAKGLHPCNKICSTLPVWAGDWEIVARIKAYHFTDQQRKAGSLDLMGSLL